MTQLAMEPLGVAPPGCAEAMSWRCEGTVMVPGEPQMSGDLIELLFDLSFFLWLWYLP